jgi:hypothetical protein
MRLREKIFSKWAAWAPRKRKLSAVKRLVAEMTRERKLVVVFDTMTSLCKESLGRRAATLQQLSKSMYNRKLLICAYAIANRTSNVIMIDCWRRWAAWSKNKRKFKALVWQFHFNYHDCRLRGKFGFMPQSYGILITPL